MNNFALNIDIIKGINLGNNIPNALFTYILILFIPKKKKKNNKIIIFKKKKKNNSKRLIKLYYLQKIKVMNLM